MPQPKYENFPTLLEALKWDTKEDLYELVFFPWEDVLVSKYLGEYKPMATYVKRCDKCKTKENIRWVYFMSPPKTWEMLCGRAGYISICIKCKRQITFHLTVMN